MKRFRFSSLMLVLGLLFIYLPMLILVIYSFTASKLVTVWGGWSIKWSVGLPANPQLSGPRVSSPFPASPPPSPSVGCCRAGRRPT